MIGFYPNSHKHAPGLGGKINGKIDAMIIDWRKHGIGVVKERKKR